jgi:hypothetical protein
VTGIEDRSRATTTAAEDAGVEGNTRLTAGTAAALFVLLAVEGFTVLSVNGMLTLHAFVGMVLVPFALVKVGSTTYRFVRYYGGDDAYVRRGPPHTILRVLGPLVTLTTIALLATGIILIVAGRAHENPWRDLHRLSFIAWFAVMTVHVLGHIIETLRVAPRDWVRATSRWPRGSAIRRFTLLSALVAGVGLGIVIQPKVADWHNDSHHDRFGERLGAVTATARR